MLKEQSDRSLKDIYTSKVFIQSLIDDLEPKWSQPSVEYTSSISSDKEVA